MHTLTSKSYYPRSPVYSISVARQHALKPLAIKAENREDRPLQRATPFGDPARARTTSYIPSASFSHIYKHKLAISIGCIRTFGATERQST